MSAGFEVRRPDRRPWWAVSAGIVLTLAVTACGGSDPEEAASSAQEAEMSTEVTETTEPAETTTATPSNTEPPLNAADLAGGMLSAGEMNLIFRAQGGIAELPPTAIFHVDACGTGPAFAGVTPGASQVGQFQTGTADNLLGIYHAYVGYYPGAAEQVFAATAVPDGCNQFMVTHVATEAFTPFPATSAAAGEAPPDAPANTRLLGFTTEQGDGFQEAFVQLGDFVLALFYYNPNGESSEAEMGEYLAYTLPRFTELAGEPGT